MTDEVSDTPPGSELSDEDLVVRVAHSKDRVAFRMIFERYGTKLKAFMIRSGASPDSAEEAAQETLIAVWRRAETFDAERASAAAWLFAIARNKRIDLLRRAARKEPDGEDPTFLPDPPAQPDTALAAQQRETAMQAALSALTEDQLTVVRLSFYDGLAHSEIAEHLGIPLGTVKSRLRLAFGKLRDALGAEFRHEIDHQ